MIKSRLDGDRIFVIREFLTAGECSSYVARSETAGYEEAAISTARGAVMDKEIRDNARYILDDAYLADELWRRVRPFVPQAMDGWHAVGLNERFRFYRYDPAQKFAPHYDGFFSRDNGERSRLTFMVYLNAEFAGGETRFYDQDQELRVAVRPERGMALAFEHRQLHEGAPVLSGRKYVLRTDVMYALATPVAGGA